MTIIKIHGKPDRGPVHTFKIKPEELHSTYRCPKCDCQFLKEETLKSHREAFAH